MELVPHKRLRNTDKFDDPKLPGEVLVTIVLKNSCGTARAIVQEGIPAVIPAFSVPLAARPRPRWRVARTCSILHTMSSTAPIALLLTDLVDSTAHAERLGDDAWAALSTAHDHAARNLLRQWRGREIDKTDGFLLIFNRPADALGFAFAYHRMLGRMEPPLWARAGLHVGAVMVRSNAQADVEWGAKPVEVDGSNKSLAARVMSVALGGQTLITGAAREALGPVAQRVVSHGHWRLKGVADPVELFEAGEPGAPFMPPPDGQKAYRVTRRGDLWLPVRETHHSLPAQRDAFVGRNDALRGLAERFESGARLVSVLGMGGSGKTRLATRFGRFWLGDYPGGVWFCDLAPVRTLSGVMHAVAKGLDVPLGNEDPVTQLGHAIAGRGHCLVILDNFEQVARHAEETVGRWLERASQARILVTTREVLGIQGEEAFALAPLVPAESIELFMRRAAAARNGFDPDPQEHKAIEALVRLLDGLPLAIELAAARARLLSPSALLARMSERFKLLALAGRRQDRQATLRATFDWSWDLLTAAEKSALAQLSVFEGGFTLEAVEAVVDVSSADDTLWTADVLHSLVDKSFVRVLDGDRFDLLVSVQAYAAEHLETAGRFAGSGASALHEAQQRHAAWFAALGPERAVERDCAELPNLVSACRRSISTGQASSAVGALDGAWAALSLRGPFAAGAALAEAVCGMPGLSAAAAARAHAAGGRAWSAAGRVVDARLHLDTALALARDSGERRCQTLAMIDLATLNKLQGRVPEAHEGNTKALAMAREIGDAATECAALSGLGNAAFNLGLIEEARGHYEAGLARACEIDDLRWQCALLGNLGMLHANVGRMDDARRRCEGALALARRLGDRQREGNTLGNLGMLHIVEGRLDDAITTLEQALQVARQLGHVQLESVVQCNLGLALEKSGRIAEALPRFDAALQAVRKLGDRNSEGQFVGYLGRAYARQRDFTKARACFASGQALLREVADPLSLGVLLCNSAECEWGDVNSPLAQSLLEEAQTIAVATGAGPQSELGLALNRVRQMLTPQGADRSSELSCSGSTDQVV